jgi:hypothetical protein
MTDELPFKVVRSNGQDEVLARAMNLLVARAAFREAARLYPDELIELGQGARELVGDTGGPGAGSACSARCGSFTPVLLASARRCALRPQHRARSARKRNCGDRIAGVGSFNGASDEPVVGCRSGRAVLARSRYQDKRARKRGTSSILVRGQSVQHL